MAPAVAGMPPPLRAGVVAVVIFWGSLATFMLVTHIVVAAASAGQVSAAVAGARDVVPPGGRGR